MHELSKLQIGDDLPLSIVIIIAALDYRNIYWLFPFNGSDIGIIVFVVVTVCPRSLDPIYSKLVYKMGHDFWDNQYILNGID